MPRPVHASATALPDRGSSTALERWSVGALARWSLLHCVRQSMYFLRGTALQRRPHLWIRNRAVYTPHWAIRSYPLASLPRQLRLEGFNSQPPFCRCRLHAPSHRPLSAPGRWPMSSFVRSQKARASLPVELHPSAASHSLRPTAAGIDWSAAESASCETRGAWISTPLSRFILPRRLGTDVQVSRVRPGI